MKRLISPIAASAVLLAMPLAACSLYGGVNDNSLVTQCTTEIQQQVLIVSVEKNAAKQVAAARELDEARNARARGNMVECLVHTQNSNTALR